MLRSHNLLTLFIRLLLFYPFFYIEIFRIYIPLLLFFVPMYAQVIRLAFYIFSFYSAFCVSQRKKSQTFNAFDCVHSLPKVVFQSYDFLTLKAGFFNDAVITVF